ncbi:TIGR04463 family radical SAM/SPASM RiPP maturase [Streptomyces sp. NPDC000888]
MPSLVPSHYNIFVPLRHGRKLAYNSLTGASAVWEESDSKIFEQISATERVESDDELIKQLLYGGFIIRDDMDELEILRREYEEYRFDPTGMVLTVAPTLMCNFGCDYCFQGSCKPVGKMDQHVQDALIALVDRAAPGIRRLHVAWYGGEPLLAREVIESLSQRMISLCTKRSITYDAMIVTNGHQLNTDVARSLHRNRVGTAQITLDGAAEYHDKRRALLGGQGTFQRIVTNLRRIVEEVPLRITIRINIDSRNSEKIPELLDNLSELGFSRRKNFGVYFAPVEAISESCHDVASVCMSKSQYGQLEADLTRYAYELGLTSLPYPSRFRGVCGAVRPKGFVVAPNGDLHKCWDTIHLSERRVGTLFDLDSLRDDERVLEWLRWTPFANDTCVNCKILPNCAGSCAHKFINPDQTLGEAGSLPCPSWKYNIKERLILRAEQSGMISADDYDPSQIRTDPAEICSVPYPDELTPTEPSEPIRRLLPLTVLRG